MEKLLKTIADIRDHWLSIPDKVLGKGDKTRQRMNGMIFSLLSLVDGVSSLNDFEQITLVVKGKKLNGKNIELHSKWFNYE